MINKKSHKGYTKLSLPFTNPDELTENIIQSNCDTITPPNEAYVKSYEAPIGIKNINNLKQFITGQ